MPLTIEIGQILFQAASVRLTGNGHTAERIYGLNVVAPCLSLALSSSYRSRGNDRIFARVSVRAGTSVRFFA